MKNWFKALARTRDVIVGGLTRLVTGTAKPDAASMEQMEEALLSADVPARFAGELLKDARLLAGETLRARLTASLRACFDGNRAFQWSDGPKPRVVLLVGVNGSGKTTTAAKLAAMAKARGLNPVLAAADTFRAAGTDQLRIWADRVGCDVVSGKQGSDAAAVAFDAIRAAQSRGADVVFIDTAGRMHTKHPLMEELQKVRRAAAKGLDGAPHEVWIVLDASVGNNALVQARTFHEWVPLTGAIVAKLDGSAKAGFLLGLRKDLGLSVLFAGLGEGMDDLVPFDAAEFVQGLVGGAEE